MWAGAMLWPALQAPGGRIVMDIGDPVLNAAILQWNARTLPLTDAWWNFPAFAPAEGITAFTEHLLGLYPLATPLMWITGNPVLAYDIVAFASFPLTAAGMFAVAQRLTGSALGGFVAAIAFTFSPYRVSHLSHIQVLWTFGIPLAVLGLHEWLEHRTRVGLMLFGAGWLVTAASNGYLMVFFGIYLLFWAAWFCTKRTTVGRLPGIVLAGAIATLPLVPVLLGYANVHRNYDLRRSVAEIASYGADIAGVLRPWPGLPVPSMWLEEAYGEGSIYPGMAIVILALTGVIGRARRMRIERQFPRWLTGAAFLAAATFLAAALVAARTDVRYDLGFMRLSLTHAGKPLTFGVIALLAAVAMSPRVRPVLRARSTMMFHALMVPMMWVLSLGPVGRLQGVEVTPGLPYQWLLDLPGMMTLRVPARFWLLATFSLAVLGGYGAARLSGNRLGRSITALALALMLAEGWAGVAGDPVNPFPAVTPVDSSGGPVLELPLDRVDLNTVAMLRAVTGGYRAVNGYSGFEPPHFSPLRFGIRVRDPGVLDELRRWTPYHVSIRSDDSDGLRSWITSTQPDARLIAERSGRVLYALGARTSAPGATRARDAERPVDLPFTISRASCGHKLLKDAHDGSLITRWECGLAKPGQYIEVDLGAVRTVSGVVNGLGPYSSDSPRGLRVTVSRDGVRWTTAWEGATAALALRAALESPARVNLHVTFPPVEARYIGLTQTGEESGWFWSIAELRVVR
jgi:hypothetical protein